MAQSAKHIVPRFHHRGWETMYNVMLVSRGTNTYIASNDRQNQQQQHHQSSSSSCANIYNSNNTFKETNYINCNSNYNNSSSLTYRTNTTKDKNTIIQNNETLVIVDETSALKLRQERERLGLTVDDVANETLLSAETIRLIETRKCPVMMSVLRLVIQLYGISPFDINVTIVSR